MNNDENIILTTYYIILQREVNQAVETYTHIIPQIKKTPCRNNGEKSMMVVVVAAVVIEEVDDNHYRYRSLEV